MNKFRRLAFLFPGQGAQYPGMAADFVKNYSAARLTFEEADDILKRPLSKIILDGPADVLTQTKNSQIGIYVASIALLRVVQESYDLKPYVCAGLSLGEYTALTAGEWISFREAVPLVQHRGDFMNEACESTKGTMAVVMGLDAASVDEIVKTVNLPNDLWVANYNCPGQIVISGTNKGIEAGTEAAKARGAKRVIPLQVHGAFHSGLMKGAEAKLTPFIQQASLKQGTSKMVMNAPGNFVENTDDIRRCLIKQVSHSVKWEQGISAMQQHEVDLYIEFGPGKTLSGMNKRIGVSGHTLSIENIEDLALVNEFIKKGEIA